MPSRDGRSTRYRPTGRAFAIDGRPITPLARLSAWRGSDPHWRRSYGRVKTRPHRCGITIESLRLAVLARDGVHAAGLRSDRVLAALSAPLERRKRVSSADPLGKDLDVPVRSMYADPLSIPDQPSGTLHAHDGGQTVLPCDYRAMRHQAPDFRHQSLDRDEQRRPTGIRKGSDQNVARFEIGLRQVMDDARPALDGAGGNRQADQRAGRYIVASVGPGHGLTIGREHPGRCEQLIRPELVFAPANELLVCPVRAHGLLQLLEPQ